jgi:hypothetical protein
MFIYLMILKSLYTFHLSTINKGIIIYKIVFIKNPYKINKVNINLFNKSIISFKISLIFVI